MLEIPKKYLKKSERPWSNSQKNPNHAFSLDSLRGIQGIIEVIVGGISWKLFVETAGISLFSLIVELLNTLKELQEKCLIKLLKE